MFIVTKRAFKFYFRDSNGVRSCHEIPREFMGDVPDAVTKHPLFTAAVKGGQIIVPASKADKSIYKADSEAKVAEAAFDIRPDAEFGMNPPEGEAEEAPKKRTRKK